MRPLRDYDAELKALDKRARELRARRVEQLGALVVATGADTLDTATLAGVLLDALAQGNDQREAWAARGAGFFLARGNRARRASRVNAAPAHED